MFSQALLLGGHSILLFNSSEGRIRVEILVVNASGIAFWRAVLFQDYCLTLELEGSRSEATRKAGSAGSFLLSQQSAGR